MKPKVSMLTSLLLFTIFALGVTLWRTGYEVMPLREQAKSYRRELGHFKVEDPDKIHAQGAQGVYSRVWKWQLYLPVTRTYKLNVFEGVASERAPNFKQVWLDGLQSREFELIDGQFSLDVSVEEYDGKWWCRYGYHNEIKATFEIQPNEDWLKDLQKFTAHGDAGQGVVGTFAPDEPVILMHMRRGIITTVGDDWAIEEPIGAADSLVIWIE